MSEEVLAKILPVEIVLHISDYMEKDDIIDKGKGDATKVIVIWSTAIIVVGILYIIIFAGLSFIR